MVPLIIRTVLESIKDRKELSLDPYIKLKCTHKHDTKYFFSFLSSEDCERGVVGVYKINIEVAQNVYKFMGSLIRWECGHGESYIKFIPFNHEFTAGSYITLHVVMMTTCHICSQ